MDTAELDKKYVDFIDDLVSQISPLLPKDVNKLQEGYLADNIKYCACQLAKSLQNEEVFQKLDFQTQCKYIQIMAEWSFHKEIDLFRSGISPKYWKIVMQKIWYTIWEVMFACVQNDAPDPVVLDLVERYVGRTYLDAIEELKNSNLIDQETEKNAKVQSNIQIMAEEYKSKKNLKKLKTVINYILLFLVICIVVSCLILRFKTYGIIAVMCFLVVYNIIPLNKFK